MAKMGWMLTGDGFPKKWNKAWGKAWDTIITITGKESIPAGIPHDVELNLYRWAAKLAAKSVDDSVVGKVRSTACPEILEEPTMTLEQIAPHLS